MDKQRKVIILIIQGKFRGVLSSDFCVATRKQFKSFFRGRVPRKNSSRPASVRAIGFTSSESARFRVKARKLALSAAQPLKFKA